MVTCSIWWHSVCWFQQNYKVKVRKASCSESRPCQLSAHYRSSSGSVWLELDILVSEQQITFIIWWLIYSFVVTAGSPGSEHHRTHLNWWLLIQDPNVFRWKIRRKFLLFPFVYFILLLLNLTVWSVIVNKYSNWRFFSTDPLWHFKIIPFSPNLYPDFEYSLFALNQRRLCC